MVFLSESAGLCPNNNTAIATPLFLITFHDGLKVFSEGSPSSFDFNTTYNQTYRNLIDHGMFGIVNAVPDHNGNWHGGAEDRTPGDNNGYLFSVNVADNGSLLFQYNIDHLCIGA